MHRNRRNLWGLRRSMVLIAVQLSVLNSLAHYSLRQFGRAKDIARTMVFLSSPLLSRHISGETLTVSGGMEGRLLWNPEDIDPHGIRRRIDEQ